jgi:hypothetical protein
MRRKRALKRGRAISILIAGVVGYVLGGWNTATLRNADVSAAQMVALRFPQDWGDASAVAAAPAATRSAVVAGNSQLALLSPEPMVPQTSVPQTSVSQASVPQASGLQAAVPTAAVEQTGLSRAPAAAPPQPTPAATQTSETKPTAAPTHRPDRLGFILNDAQIASIKERLHLTPDQERMWPAVEIALRNIAYTSAREAHRRGAPASAAQLASADPNSVEAQGLKSAAIPLIMSFNSEQKDEVRSLAHIMGLDQLATQF